MTSSWKTFGRTVEIITIVLLVFAVSYLWVNSGSEDTEAPQVASQAPDAETETVERSYQPPVPSSADTGTYRQLEETPPYIDISPPADLYQQPYQTGPAASSTIFARSCDSNRTLSSSLPPTANAGRITLKIATVAPEGSQWMKDMRASAKEIQERTYGRVQIRYYGGGVMGNDTKVLGKIRLGILHGGAFTPSALQKIYPDLSIYGLPFLFQSNDEVDYVRKKLDERLLRGLREAGFVSFGFAATGFAVIMSNEPVRGLDDLIGKRVWVPEGETISHTSMEALSLRPVILPLTDVLTGLQTGLIDIVSMSPIGALVLQWHTKVKFITDMPLVYTMGFMAVDIRAFNKIDAADQEILTEVMTRVYCHFDKANLIDNKEAYEALLITGIQNVMVTVDEFVRIREIVEASNRRLVEQGFFSKTLYEDLLDYIEDFRIQSR
jgi:TRAP-type C4-dicarboxylate transport system substrate-binding protein